MMNRYLISTTLVLFFIFLAMGFYNHSSTYHHPSDQDTSEKPHQSMPSVLDISAPSPDVGRIATASPLATQSPPVSKKRIISLLDQAREGKRDLLNSLTNIRKQCPDTWNQNRCNSMTREFLLRVLPRDQQAKVLQIFDQYIDYEYYLATTRPTLNKSLEEGYQAILEIRSHFFNKNVRKLLFGLEEAKMRFKFLKQHWLEKFAHNNDNNNPDQLLKAYNKMEKQAYGSLLNEVKKQVPPSIQHQKQIDFLVSSLQYATSTEQKTDIHTALTRLKKQQLTVNKK